MDRAKTLLLGVIAVAAACADGENETNWQDQQTWSSQHFVYHARPDDTAIDASVLSYLEANAGLVAQGLFGIDPSKWGPVHYFKYLDFADFAKNNPCDSGPDTGGCTRYFPNGRIEVHSPLALDPHELVHAYAKTFGFPSPFLAEGLAVSVSCEPSMESFLDDGALQERQNLPSSPWDVAYTFPGGDEVDYYVAAGMFTTWLIDHAGIGPVLSIYGKLPSDASASDFAAAVLNETGTSVDDLWQAMATSYARRPCMEIAGCTALDPTSTPYERSRPFTVVPQAGAIVSWTDEWTNVSSNAPPAVRACTAADGTSSDIAWPYPRSKNTTTILLPNRASYVLTSGLDLTDSDAGAAPPVDYSSTPLPPASVGTSCFGLQPIAVDDVGLSVQIWPSPNPIIFAIDPPERWPTIGNVELDMHTGSTSSFVADVCASCDDGALAGCTELTPVFNYSPLPTTTPGAAWFQIQWNPPSPTELLTLTLAFGALPANDAGP